MTISLQEREGLKSFIEETLRHKDEKLVARLVKEEKAKNFAAVVRKGMEGSQVMEDDEIPF